MGENDRERMKGTRNGERKERGLGTKRGDRIWIIKYDEWRKGRAEGMDTIDVVPPANAIYRAFNY